MPSDHDASAREPSEVEVAAVEMMSRDHARMRKAGTALAEAALRVIREYDGTHRLSLAVADWAKAIANEGDRPWPVADRRLPGLEHAEGIADHLYQWMLRVLERTDDRARKIDLQDIAKGAKYVLDEIRIERARLSRALGDGERDGGGSDG